MKKTLILLLTVFTFLPFAAFADDPDHFAACNDDNDCVIVPHTACAPQTSVNRYSLPYYSAHVANLSIFTSCKTSPPDKLNAVAKCENNTCVLTEPNPSPTVPSETNPSK